MSDQKIAINTRLVIQWQPRQQLQQAEQVDFINGPALKILEVLETQQLSKNLNLSNLQSNKSDLARLESKIDLLLLLFTRSQLKQQNNITNYPVTLSAESIVISTSETMELEQLLEIEIYFNQDCTEAVILSGKVVASQQADTVTVQLLNIGRVTQSYLEKYIFRLHRSEIARLKQI